MNDLMNITYSSSIRDMCAVNSSFDSGILRIAYVGDNRNGSSISKDVFLRAIKTIYNCPVVCNYNREEDQIGSHDMEIVVKDGVPKLVNLTTPVGVVPESAKYWFEDIEEDDGTVHEYLCVEVLIWKRQEAYEKIRENGITDESMEIKVVSGHTKNGIYIIDDFEFQAFCLLESAEPCYESASLAMFGINEDRFSALCAEMMEEFKNSFTQVKSSKEVDIHPQNILTEGGDVRLDKKYELLAKYGLTAEQFDMDIEPMSEEELASELERRFAEGHTEEGGAAAGEGEVFSLTGEQFRDGLIEALGTETTETEWGVWPRYCYCDYNAETNEVYCWDSSDWRLYGFSYSMNGDNVVIDFASKKRKKFSVVDFDEGDAEFSLEGTVTSIVSSAVSANEETLRNQFASDRAALEEQFNTASNTINELNTEVCELRQYREHRLAEDRAADEDAVFSMFADLAGIEAFEELRTNCAELTIDELEEKCFAIRGRNSSTQTFSAHTTKAPRLPVEKNSVNSDEPYGSLFLEFPPKNR